MQCVDVNTIEDIWTSAAVEEAIATSKSLAKAWMIKDAIGEDGRQGDVYLVRIAGAPTNTKAKPQNVILVKGEATGHTHVLKSRKVTYTPATSLGFILGVLDVCEESVLTHNEHGPIIVPQGRYEVRGQFQGAEFAERLAD